MGEPPQSQLSALIHTITRSHLITSLSTYQVVCTRIEKQIQNNYRLCLFARLPATLAVASPGTLAPPPPPVTMFSFSELGTIVSSSGLRFLAYVFLRWVTCMHFTVNFRYCELMIYPDPWSSSPTINLPFTDLLSGLPLPELVV